MEEKKILSDKEIEKVALNDAIENFKKQKQSGDPTQTMATPATIPTKTAFNANDVYSNVTKETDPDLMVGYEIIDLPSKGLFFTKVPQVRVEYLTAKDEDLLTTPSLIENGTVLDELLKRKIKTIIDIDKMLMGDKNAVLLFLRASSYGSKYEVNVINPFNGRAFKSMIDLTKLKYKEISELPDENGEFTLELPKRKKMIKFRLLTHKESVALLKKAELLKDSYSALFAETNTLRLKTSITEIEGNRDANYIHRFVDAMPALDALTIRKKMQDVSPDVDMSYDFVTPAGEPFRAPIVMGIDFFFPSL